MTLQSSLTDIQPAYDDGLARLYCADSRHLDFLPDRSIDFTVTSPPYAVGIPYDSPYDDHIPYQKYLEWCREWLTELYRVTSVRGRACLNIPLDVHFQGRRPVYTDYVQLCTQLGWKYETTMVWLKHSGLSPNNLISWGESHNPNVRVGSETVLVLCKGAWNRQRKGTSQVSLEEFNEWVSGVWRIPGEDSPLHPVVFPEELVRRCLLMFGYKEDHVLDPFVGSGTTPLVARRFGRQVTGVDISPVYVERASQRLASSF